jgi:hypothetical protein
MEVHRVVAGGTDDRLAITRNRVRPPDISPCIVDSMPVLISSPHPSQERGQPTGDAKRGTQVQPKRCLLARVRRLHALIVPVATTCSPALASKILCNLRNEVNVNCHFIQKFQKNRKASPSATTAKLK